MSQPHGWYVIKAREAQRRGLPLAPSREYRAQLYVDNDRVALQVWVTSGHESLLVFIGAAGIHHMPLPVGAQDFGFQADGPWVADLEAHYLALEQAIADHDALQGEPQPESVKTEFELHSEKVERMRQYIIEKRKDGIADAIRKINQHRTAQP